MTDTPTPEEVEALDPELYAHSFSPTYGCYMVEWEKYRALMTERDSLSARVAELEAECDILNNAGIVEIAARNQNVMEYMKHWEKRAEKAEAQQSLAQRVRVKPLEWSERRNQPSAVIYKGAGADCVYKLTLHKDGSGNLCRLGFKTKRVAPYATTSAGLEWFKAAAQADYERRILSVLEPAPEDGRIADYERAYQYALNFSDALRERLFPENADWKPLGDLLGLLTQIDNMTTALITAQQAAGVLLSSLDQDEWRGAIKPREFLTAIATQEEDR